MNYKREAQKAGMLKGATWLVSKIFMIFALYILTKSILSAVAIWFFYELAQWTDNASKEFERMERIMEANDLAQGTPKKP
jgi:multidrug resistance efflux pump